MTTILPPWSYLDGYEPPPVRDDWDEWTLDPCWRCGTRISVAEWVDGQSTRAVVTVAETDAMYPRRCEAGHMVTLCPGDRIDVRLCTACAQGVAS